MMFSLSLARCGAFTATAVMLLWVTTTNAKTAELIGAGKWTLLSAVAPRTNAPRGRGQDGRTDSTGSPEPATVGQAGDKSGEQVGLSGTYTGMVTMTGGHEMSGQGTLTITGNTFTLAVEGVTYNGRVYAVRTRGYTGVTLYFSDITDPVTNTPVVVNARVRKVGNDLTLSSPPGSRGKFTFAPQLPTGELKSPTPKNPPKSKINRRPTKPRPTGLRKRVSSQKRSQHGR